MLKNDPWLRAILLARIMLYANFMVYAASIPVLIPEWNMSAAEAGSIVSGFMLAYAGSLFVSSRLADRYGARRIFMLAAVSSAGTALLFGFLARDYWSALLLYSLTASTQGGLYTPAIMMLSDRYESARRGSAIGYLIASTSLGYAFSLLLAGLSLAWGSYQTAFVTAGCVPSIGVVLAWTALRQTENVVHTRTVTASLIKLIRGSRNLRCLTAGYVAHSWELLGMWAWTPAFLVSAAALAGGGQANAALGPYLAALMHGVGALASMTMGRLSDRLGRRYVLIVVAAAGTGMSFIFGWLITFPVTLLVLLGMIYYYLAIGDSAVLSAAISEAAPSGHLGDVLALRALLGFGAGAVSPVVFGWLLDLFQASGNETVQWGVAFSMLGLGGLLATWYGWRYREIGQS